MLDDESVNAQAVTRDYKLELSVVADQLPLLSVFGGKITTYRKLAEAAVDRLAPFFPTMTARWTADTPLPGGDFADRDSLAQQLQLQYPWLPLAVQQRYLRSYGSRSHLLLLKAASIADLGEHFGAGLYQAEVDYLCQHEWAVLADEILWRRTKLGLQLDPAQQQRLQHICKAGQHSCSQTGS